MREASKNSGKIFSVTFEKIHRYLQKPDNKSAFSFKEDIVDGLKCLAESYVNDLVEASANLQKMSTGAFQKIGSYLQTPNDNNKNEIENIEKTESTKHAASLFKAYERLKNVSSGALQHIGSYLLQEPSDARKDIISEIVKKACKEYVDELFEPSKNLNAMSSEVFQKTVDYLKNPDNNNTSEIINIVEKESTKYVEKLFDILDKTSKNKLLPNHFADYMVLASFFQNFDDRITKGKPSSPSLIIDNFVSKSVKEEINDFGTNQKKLQVQTLKKLHRKTKIP